MSRIRTNPLHREKSRTSNYGDDDDSDGKQSTDGSAASPVRRKEVDDEKIKQIRNDYRVFGMILFFSFGLYCIAYTCESFITSMLLPRSEFKEWNSFNDFYPFYLSQHKDQTCKALHFLGTSIITMMMVKSPDIALSFIPAFFVGLTLRILTVHLDTGIIEGILMLLVFLYTNKVLSHSLTKGIIVLAVGYGFAWIAHFYYENNRPATFIYPAYSLLGDFTMWYELATMQKSFLVE